MLICGFAVVCAGRSQKLLRGNLFARGPIGCFNQAPAFKSIMRGPSRPLWVSRRCGPFRLGMTFRGCFQQLTVRNPSYHLLQACELRALQFHLQFPLSNTRQHFYLAISDRHNVVSNGRNHRLYRSGRRSYPVYLSLRILSVVQDNYHLAAQPQIYRPQTQRRRRIRHHKVVLHPLLPHAYSISRLLRPRHNPRSSWRHCQSMENRP